MNTQERDWIEQQLVEMERERGVVSAKLAGLIAIPDPTEDELVEHEQALDDLTVLEHKIEGFSGRLGDAEYLDDVRWARGR